MASSLRQATKAFARAVTQSVASKNQNNLISVVRKPKRKQYFHDQHNTVIGLFSGLPPVMKNKARYAV